MPKISYDAITADLTTFADVMNSTETLPLHRISPITITFHVIDVHGEERTQQERFNALQDQIMLFCDTYQAHDLTWETAIDRYDDGAVHRSVSLLMPNGAVRYQVLWIEKERGDVDANA